MSPEQNNQRRTSMSLEKPTVAEVKKAQAVVAELQKIRDEIAGKLVEVENTTSDAHVAMERIPSLNSRRLDLKVDVEMGKTKSQEELDKVTAEIAELDSVAQHHGELVEGLKSRLAASEAALTQPGEMLHQMQKAFIRNEAEAVHMEYVATAKAMGDQFRRIVALSTIYNQGHGGPDMFANGYEHLSLSIPLFQFDSCGEWPSDAGSNWPRMQYIQEIASPSQIIYRNSDEADEKSRLNGLGIETK